MMNNSFVLLLTQYWPLLLQGMWTTLKLWLSCLSISIAVGMMSGIVRAQQLRRGWYAPILDGVIFMLRAVPVYVQLLCGYFVLFPLVMPQVSATLTGIIVLGFCSAAYTSEIVRAGVNTIPVGQWEAAHALGYSTWQQLYYIILPQVVQAILPMLLNEGNMLLKSTSLLATIGVVELAKVGTNIAVRTFDTANIYIIIAFIYLSLSGLLELSNKWLLRRRNL